MNIWILVGIIILVAVVIMLSRGPSAKRGEQRILTDDEIRKTLQKGNKIEAIKMYRELYGVDLKTAKEAVEEME